MLESSTDTGRAGIRVQGGLEYIFWVANRILTKRVNIENGTFETCFCRGTDFQIASEYPKMPETRHVVRALATTVFITLRALLAIPSQLHRQFW
jgi:hypothetical protein